MHVYSLFVQPKQHIKLVPCTYHKTLPVTKIYIKRKYFTYRKTIYPKCT